MAKERLNIIDKNDEVIGSEKRKVIHEKGLLHREVHVYFITPNHEIIFQHRAKDKDTFPDLLDATVGGHVEIGDSYERAAIKETLEETGYNITEGNLIPFGKIVLKVKDESTGIVNHAIQKEFIYAYSGDVNDLKIEEGKGLGFEAWPIAKLLQLDEEEREKFIPGIYAFISTKLIKFVNESDIFKLGRVDSIKSRLF